MGDHHDGQTHLDPEESRDLIPSIITREDLNTFEQENILEAQIWAMQTRNLQSMDVFSEVFLCSLHKRMFGKIWKWAGLYRKSNKNIGVDYIKISIELKKLLDDLRYWFYNSIFSVSERAVMFHHRLVKIHLFTNGNGRHARLCADIIVAKHQGKKLTWGSNYNLVKSDIIRKSYIDALREADKGSYKALFEFAQV